MRIRDKIQQVTKIYFSDDIKISDQFKKLGSAGMFDLKTFTQIIGVLADYLEELELKEKERELEIKELIESLKIKKQTKKTKKV